MIPAQSRVGFDNLTAGLLVPEQFALLARLVVEMFEEVGIGLGISGDTQYQIIILWLPGVCFRVFSWSG